MKYVHLSPISPCTLREDKYLLQPVRHAYIMMDTQSFGFMIFVCEVHDERKPLPS